MRCLQITSSFTIMKLRFLVSPPPLEIFRIFLSGYHFVLKWNWPNFILSFEIFLKYVFFLGSVGIELIFTTTLLGWPKQPIKWDILYHVMSCSVFKWGVGWRRGFCYSGASWALDGENTVCCIRFYQYYWLLFSSPLATLLTCSYPNWWLFLPLFLRILLPISPGRGEEVRD